MTKFFLLIVIVFSFISYGSDNCDADSISYHIDEDYCSSYNAGKFFKGYFKDALKLEDLSVRTYDGDYDDPTTSVTLENSEVSIYLRYTTRSNDANYDIDEHSICVVESCSIIEK